MYIASLRTVVIKLSVFVIYVVKEFYYLTFSFTFIIRLEVGCNQKGLDHYSPVGNDEYICWTLFHPYINSLDSRV